MALSHSPKIVTDGLILYIDPGSAKCYPGSGTVVNNLRGLGDERTPYQSFVDSSAWIPTTGTAPSSLTFRAFETTAGGVGISAGGVLTVGRKYQVSISIKTCVGNFQLRNGLNSGGAPLILSASSAGLYNATFTASNSSFYLRANSALRIEFDSISIRETSGANIVGGVTLETEAINVFQFNGVDGSLNVDNFQNIIGAYSSIYWINTARTNDWRFLNAANFRYSAPWHRSATSLSFDDRGVSGSERFISLSNPINSNVWTQVSVTRTADFTTTVYINAINNGQTTGWSDEVRLLNIGFKTNDTAFSPFQGKSGPVSIYNRALTAAEIQQNFNAVRSRFEI